MLDETCWMTRTVETAYKSFLQFPVILHSLRFRSSKVFNFNTVQKKLGETPGEAWEVSKEIGETYGEMKENMKGIVTRQTSKPLSQQFLNHFIYCRIHPRMTAEYALWANQYIAVHYFYGLLPHMVSLQNLL